jgi:hypothetical protein
MEWTGRGQATALCWVFPAANLLTAGGRAGTHGLFETRNLDRLATRVNLNLDPIGCARLIVSLLECAGNPDVDDPVLLINDHSLARGHEAGTECGRSFFIEKSLHVVEKVCPPLGGEIPPALIQACELPLAEIQRPHGGFPAEGDDRVLICLGQWRGLSGEQSTARQHPQKRQQPIAQ